MSVDIWSVQVTGNAGGQRWTVGEVVCREEEGGKEVKAGQDPCGQSHAAVADAVCVCASVGEGNDVMA